MNETRDHLLKLLRMLGSDQLGERAAAALKVDAYVKKLGGWEVVLRPPATASAAAYNPLQQYAAAQATSPYGQQTYGEHYYNSYDDLLRSMGRR